MPLGKFVALEIKNIQEIYDSGCTCPAQQNLPESTFYSFLASRFIDPAFDIFMLQNCFALSVGFELLSVFRKNHDRRASGSLSV